MTFFNCVSESRALHSDSTADIGILVKRLSEVAALAVADTQPDASQCESSSSEYPGGVCFSKSTEAAVSFSAMFSHKSEIPPQETNITDVHEGKCSLFYKHSSVFSRGLFEWDFICQPNNLGSWRT